MTFFFPFSLHIYPLFDDVESIYSQKHSSGNVTDTQMMLENTMQ